MYNKGDIIYTNEIINHFYKGKHLYYNVRCTICGKERAIRCDNLHHSCRSCARKKRDPQTRLIKDLTGQIFGHWYVVGKAKKWNYWHCKDISTGTERDVFRGNLTQGLSKGDGSVSSWGEQSVVYILQSLQIPYIKEYTNNDLKTPQGGYYRFDFALLDLNNNIVGFIEYDGRQHFQYDQNWKMTQKDFQKLQLSDQYKTNYCQQHNLPLFRLTNLDSLEQDIKSIIKQLYNSNIGVTKK